MDGSDALILVCAGVGAGLTGLRRRAGLAGQLPALLASGLPPLAANVTNTTACWPPPRVRPWVPPRAGGQWRRVRMLMLRAALGGLIGAALLLATPEEAFEAVVPWLVALGALLLLFRDRIRRWTAARQPVEPPVSPVDPGAGRS